MKRLRSGHKTLQSGSTPANVFFINAAAAETVETGAFPIKTFSIQASPTEAKERAGQK